MVGLFSDRKVGGDGAGVDGVDGRGLHKWKTERYDDEGGGGGGSETGGGGSGAL